MIDYTRLTFIGWSALCLFMAGCVGWLFSDALARKRAKEVQTHVAAGYAQWAKELEEAREQRNEFRTDLNHTKSKLSYEEARVKQLELTIAEEINLRHIAEAKVRNWTDRPKLHGKFITKERANAIVAEAEAEAIALPAPDVTVSVGDKVTYPDGSTAQIIAVTGAATSPIAQPGTTNAFGSGAQE